MRRVLRRNGHLRAFTIAESVLALFILVGSAMCSAQMYRTALQSSGLARDESLALLLCEKKVNEIRDWSRRQDVSGRYQFDGPWPDGVNDDDLRDGASSVPAVPGPPDAAAQPFADRVDDDNPRFSVAGRTWRYACYSPARAPSPVPPGVVSMTKSARILKVTSKWGSDAGAPRGRSVSIVAPILEPPRRISRIDVTPSSETLASAASLDISATASDAVGEIPDVVFLWYVAPHDGNATVVPALPSKARLRNGVMYASGTAKVTPGDCGLHVRAASDGRELWNKDSVFTLAGAKGTVVAPPFP